MSLDIFAVTALLVTQVLVVHFVPRALSHQKSRCSKLVMQKSPVT